jgi:DNA-binding NarL/FixJ family response regulator
MVNGNSPGLNQRTLVRLRELVQAMHEDAGRALPVQKLVALAEEVRLDGGLTIDFAASRRLGQPMVVLRMTEPQRDRRVLVLSRREREVAALVAKGLSNKQIAGRLFISLATVKDHVHRILRKTHLPNRAAVAAAYVGR